MNGVLIFEFWNNKHFNHYDYEVYIKAYIYNNMCVYKINAGLLLKYFKKKMFYLLSNRWQKCV